MRTKPAVRLLTLVQSLTFCLGLLPAGASAAESDFKIVNGVLKTYNGPGGAVVIPNSVTEIKGLSFYGCTNLERVVLYRAAVWVYEKGLVADTAFQGGTACTRSATVSYLWKLAGSPSAPSAAFTDVPGAADYAPAVARTVSRGITSGTGPATFGPDQTYTRGQIVTFLCWAYS